MRIENNNNISFGAYFKNNQLFKETYKKCFRSVDEDILDKFMKKCPDHEIEIMSVENIDENKEVYTVFNNMTGGILPIYMNKGAHAKPLDTIMHKLYLQTLSKASAFWDENKFTKIFKNLTGNK